VIVGELSGYNSRSGASVRDAGNSSLGAAVLVSSADGKSGNHWILRYDWVDVVEDAERTAAEILEAYTARTPLLEAWARLEDSRRGR